MDVKPKTHSSRHLSQVAPNNTQAANKTQAAPAVPEEVNEQLVKNIEAKKVDQAYTKQIQEIIADINSLEKNSDEAVLAAGCLDLCLSSLNLLLDSDEQLSIVHSPQQYLQNLRDAQELSKVVEKKLSPPISENTKSNKSTGALSDKEAKLTSIKDGEILEDISLDDGPKTTSQPEKEYIAMGEHNFFSKELANKLQELASIVSNQAQLKANKLSRKLEKAEQDPYSYVPQELISKSLAAQKTEQIHRQLGQIINHLEAKSEVKQRREQVERLEGELAAMQQQKKSAEFKEVLEETGTYRLKESHSQSTGIQEQIVGLKGTIDTIKKELEQQRLPLIHCEDALILLNKEIKFGEGAQETIEKIDQLMQAINQDRNELGLRTTSTDDLYKLQEELVLQLMYKRNAIDSFAAPNTQKQMYYAKEQIVSAALNLFANENQNNKKTKNTNALPNAQTFLKQRAQQLKAEQGKEQDKKTAKQSDILGKGPITGLAKFLHPLEAREQQKALKKAVEEILKKGEQANVELNTPLYTEEMLMEALLQKVLPKTDDKRDILTRLYASISDQLNNHQNWQPIKNTFVVPVGLGSVTVTSTTTPVGNLANDDKSKRIVDDSSSIKANYFSENYQRQVTLTNDQDAGQKKVVTKKIITGINSHDTTATKAKNLAHTELKIDDEVLVEAERHGTLSAYGITPKDLREKTDAEVIKIVRDLFPSPQANAAQNVSANAGNQQTKKAIEAKLDDTLRDIIKKNGSGWEIIKQAKVNGKSILEDTITSKDIELSQQVQAERTKENNVLLAVSMYRQDPQDVDANKQLDFLLAKIKQKPELLAQLAKQDEGLCTVLRRQAALNRAKEIFVSSLLNSSRLEELLDKANENPTKPIVFNSISLLTPDALRAALNNPGNNERQMLNEQRQAWRDLQQGLEDGSFKLTLNDKDGKPLTIQANIRQFNYGVNIGAVGSASKVAAFNGWAHVDAENAELMQQIIGKQETLLSGEIDGDSDLGKFINAQEDVLKKLINEQIKNYDAQRDKTIIALNQEIKNVKELAKQIAQMALDESYKEQGSDPYKMVARLAVLSNRLGQLTAFNCKSGKDRTGELDAEMKYLAFRIKVDGKVPEPNEKMSATQARQFLEFIYRCGSIEMQQLNTAYAGYKLEINRLGSVLEQCGITGDAAKRYLEEFFGMSAMTLE